VLARVKFSAIQAVAEKNRHDKKKTDEKALIPLPPTGFRDLFLCKAGCSAKEPAAQAGLGALQGIGNFAVCRVLQGNDAR